MSLATTTSRVSYTGDGSSTVFSYPYYFLANADLVVILRNELTFVETILILNTDYTLTGAGIQAGGAVTTMTAYSSDYTISIYRNPVETQTLDLVENDPLPAESLEKAFDKLTMIMQYISDLVTRSVKLSAGYPANTFDLTLPPDLEPNTVFIVNPGGDGLSSGPTAADIQNAQTYAANAGASAGAAAASASASSASASSSAASATAASNSAANAAAQLASAFFRDTLYKTFSDSPIAPVLGNNGKLFSIDTTGGAVIINLPSIAAVGVPFNLSIKLEAGANTITINRNGSDTLDGGTAAIVLTDVASGLLLTADASNNWSVLSAGASAPNLSVVTKTTNYTTTSSDDVILVNTAGGNITISLHAAANAVKKRITIKKISLDANDIIIDPNGAETIDGETTVTLRAVRESLTIVPDGSNWYTQSWYESAKVFIARSEQSSGTNEGATPNLTWLTRTLNTITRSANWAALSSNQITLQPGSYVVKARAPANSVDQHQTRFFNITDSTTAILGSSEFIASTTAGGTSSFINGTVVISSAKVYELQHFVNTANALNGFGVGNPSLAGTEVFAEVSIERLNPRSS